MTRDDISPGTAKPLIAGMTIGSDDKRLFLLEERIGGGAMGDVWKAKDMATSEIVGHEVCVAIKTLNPLVFTEERYRNALKLEAFRSKELHHPHIIRIHDWYEDKVIGFPFIVMEYLEGKTLDQNLAEVERFTYAETINLLSPIVDALIYAWEKHRTIHRDIKPSNIFLTVEGDIKLFDFGIAAKIRNTASTLGIGGFDSPGTLCYAPPEAGVNRKPNPRFDIYSLGVLTYELLEGNLPFKGLRHPSTPMPDTSEHLSEAQWQVLQKSFAFEEENRYFSVKEFWQAFLGAAGPSAEEVKRLKQKEAATQSAADEKATSKEKTGQKKASKEAQEIEKLPIEISVPAKIFGVLIGTSIVLVLVTPVLEKFFRFVRDYEPQIYGVTAIVLFIIGLIAAKK